MKPQKMLLNEVPNPERLAKNRRGYYEFMRANIALQREQIMKKRNTIFRLPANFRWVAKHDKAFVLIHLANLALRKKDKRTIYGLPGDSKGIGK